MQTKNRPMWLACLLSQLFWGGGLILFLLLSCAAANSAEDPAAMLLPLSLASRYLAAFIAGIAAARLSEDGLLSGLLSGCVTAVLMLLFSCLPMPGSEISFAMNLLLTAAVIPASCAGAVIGKKRTRRKSPAKKNYGRKR